MDEKCWFDCRGKPDREMDVWIRADMHELGGYLFKVLDRARPTACWYLLMTATPKIHKGADHTSFNWPAALLF